MINKSILFIALLTGLSAMNSGPVLAKASQYAIAYHSETTIDRAIEAAANKWQTSPANLYQEYEDGTLSITVTETETKLARQVAGGGMTILILDDASF